VRAPRVVKKAVAGVATLSHRCVGTSASLSLARTGQHPCSDLLCFLETRLTSLATVETSEQAASVI
jgi:hypothetical protein